MYGIEYGMDYLAVATLRGAIFFVAGFDQFGPSITVFFVWRTTLVGYFWHFIGFYTGEYFAGPLVGNCTRIDGIVFGVVWGNVRYNLVRCTMTFAWWLL